MTMTVAERLETLNVRCVPADLTQTSGATADVPCLPEWVEAPAGSLSSGKVLINTSHAADGFTPNAVLLHGRLTDRIDPDWLMAGAFEDARRLPGWSERETSTADFRGHRSAFVYGVYAVDQRVLEATTRYVVLEDRSGQYLTQLTVTTLASQHDELQTDIAVINLGLEFSTR
ncbi:LpqN/LpqT family lipoprotein [Rhodococcus sp. W8901]|nr:LpqN/LpqT family lipoprotein [Rhodococcus sp. W8901]